MDGLSSQDPLYCLTLWLCSCLYQPGAELWPMVRAGGWPEGSQDCWPGLLDPIGHPPNCQMGLGW